jgi:hypothetical protein
MNTLSFHNSFRLVYQLYVYVLNLILFKCIIFATCVALRVKRPIFRRMPIKSPPRVARSTTGITNILEEVQTSIVFYAKSLLIFYKVANMYCAEIQFC